MRKRDGHFCQFLHTDPISSHFLSFVDHIERSEAFAVIEGVVHEIHGPLKIRLRRSIEGLSDTSR